MTQQQSANHLYESFMEAGFSEEDAHHYSMKLSESFTTASLQSERLYRNEVVNLIKGLKMSQNFEA